MSLSLKKSGAACINDFIARSRLGNYNTRQILDAIWQYASKRSAVSSEKRYANNASLRTMLRTAQRKGKYVSGDKAAATAFSLTTSA